MNLAIRKFGRIEQARDVPSLGQRSDFGWRAQIEQEEAHFVATASGQQSVAQIVSESAKVTRRGHRASRKGHIRLFQRVKTMERT